MLCTWAGSDLWLKVMTSGLCSQSRNNTNWLFRYVRLHQLDPSLQAAAVAPPAPLSQRSWLPGLPCIISSSSGLFGTLIRALPRLHRAPVLKVIKQLKRKVPDKNKGNLKEKEKSNSLQHKLCYCHQCMSLMRFYFYILDGCIYKVVAIKHLTNLHKRLQKLIYPVSEYLQIIHFNVLETIKKHNLLIKLKNNKKCSCRTT